MSIKKLFLTGTLTAILSLTAFSTFANLKITNNSSISNFSVKCTGPMPGVPIRAGQTATLEWGIVKLIIGGYDGSCSFYNNGALEAKATIHIDPSLSSAQITQLDVPDSKLQVSLTPGVQTSTANINVVVSGG